MKRQEPDFMKELHKIREKLSTQWQKMNPEDFQKSMQEAKKWFRTKLKPTSLLQTK